MTRNVCLAIALFAATFATAARADTTTITVASTTSTENSGLYGAILPGFTDKTGIRNTAGITTCFGPC